VLLLKSETLSVPRNAARACLKGGFLGPEINVGTNRPLAFQYYVELLRIGRNRRAGVQTGAGGIGCCAPRAPGLV